MANRAVRFRRRLIALGLLLAAGAIAAYWLRPDPGDRRLRSFVQLHPPVSVVFTSRSEPASLRAPADEGEGFNYPGQRLWQAREGRLRLLKPDGSVHELTWGKSLPDGSTLIDVMSPSVSIDGERILFAGRKGPPDAGRFRLYQIDVDGSNLRQLTGGPEDPGCSAVPPMRFRSDGDPNLIPDDERRRIDYDDVDPVELNYERPRIAFASSRTPDLGRGHSRRATNIWWMHADGRDPKPLTANRYNDRWPFLLRSNFLAFSLWSRNQEVIAPDERDIAPWKPDMSEPRMPCDAWLGAFVQPGGGQFGSLIKPGIPVWRVRPLFNGRLVFQTRLAYPRSELPAENILYDVVQADAGLLLHSPSAETGGARPASDWLRLGPSLSRAEEPLSHATPSPCPPNHVLLAAIPLTVERGTKLDARRYGIWICRDDWDASGLHQLTAEQSELRPLFDDPEFVDAEPVAVYARRFDRFMGSTESPPAGQPMPITLADGTSYTGPTGTLFGSALYAAQLADAPGQHSGNGNGPYYVPAPKGALHEIRIYASHRDRFDDPCTPRVPGKWEHLLTARVTGESFGAQVPAGIPTVLAGFDRDGRIASWPASRADDGAARVFAFAGDHYSAARPGGKHFCVGCHPGHSGLRPEDHQHSERQR